MNTKLLLLLPIFLLANLTTKGFSHNNKMNDLPALSTDQHNHSTHDKDVNWDINMPVHATEGGHHHSEEDGRHHDFHLTRIKTLRRGKKLCCLLCQLIIAIMHLCLLICLFQKNIEMILH